jgi:hypothetical protein
MLGFPLGILSAAGAAVGFESDYELISTTTLGTAQASVVFSNLGTYSATYKHLQIRYTARSTETASDWWSMIAKVNGDTGSNYAFHRLTGDGSTVASSAGTSTALPRFGFLLTSFSSNGFNGGVMDILDPYSTTKNTTFRTFSGVTGPSRNWVELNSVLWNNTASMTSIEFSIQSGGGNFAIGSRFSIYGIKG